MRQIACTDNSDDGSYDSSSSRAHADEQRGIAEFAKGLFRAMNQCDSEPKAEQVMLDGFVKFKNAVHKKAANAQNIKHEQANELTWKINEDNLILKHAVLALTNKLEVSHITVA